MDEKRIQQDDRRQNKKFLCLPFKDSNGVIITECRRKIPDRRISNIEAVWIHDLVIGKSYKR